MKRVMHFICILSLLGGFFLLLKANPALSEVKPGEVIGPHNWEKVKDLLPKPVVDEIKNGYTINIIETTPIKSPKAYVEATRKNAGKAKVLPDKSLVNWIAGSPFPDLKANDPQAGIKMMWNWRWRWNGDDFGFGTHYDRATGTWTEKMARRLVLDKNNNLLITGTVQAVLKPIGRITLDPKPTIPGYEHIEDMVIQTNNYPRDQRGSASLFIRYRDPNKNDDMWKFIPSIRRVRRLPTSERYSALPPTIYTLDDIRYFWGKITHFDYEIVGEKKMLGIAHSKHYPALLFKPGVWVPQDENYEIRDCYLLEFKADPKIYPKYCYSKRIMYIDKQSWEGMWTDMFDRKGEYWKQQAIPNGKYVTGEGEEVNMGVGTFAIDVQSGHKTCTESRSVIFDVGYKPGLFAISSLIKISKMGLIRP
jgi:hypothetical protein